MSNIERPTKEVTTESGHKLVVKTFVTQGEKAQIREIYFLAAEAKNAGKPLTGEERPSITADRLAAKLVIVSLDGETDSDKVLDLLINGMPAAECEEVEEVIKTILEPEKKTPTSSQDTSAAGS